jgi:hypothetical protein
MNARARKASPNAVIQLAGGFGRGLLTVLQPGILGLAVLVGIAFQFPVLICCAQTTGCVGNSIPPDESPQYFPTGVFGIREFMAPVTSCLLRAMDEKPLIPPTAIAGRAVFRLTLTPTWGAPFVVRLDVRPDGSGVLVKKEARSELEAGTVTVNVRQDVSKEDVEAFDSLVNKADFWSIPTILTRFSRGRWRPVGDMGGIVGVLEGAKPGAYHVVSRYVHYNQTPLVPYDELTAYLFKNLAHFEIPPIPPVPPKRKH